MVIGEFPEKTAESVENAENYWRKICAIRKIRSFFQQTQPSSINSQSFHTSSQLGFHFQALHGII